MKKKKVTKRMMMPIVATVAVCACTVAGFSTMSYLQGNPYKMSNENGETYIPYEAKADIVDNIYEKGGQFVILEIVPYEDAGIMEMLVGTDRVKAMLDANKEALFEEFKDTAVVHENVTTVTVGGSIASQHPFIIQYDSSTDDYTVIYANNFINELVDFVDEPKVYNYILENVEVRTVVAGELTEKDLEDVSLIYVSNYAQDKEVVNFNRYIDGEISTNDLDSLPGIDRIDVYRNVDGSYQELVMNDISSVWYDAYIKNDAGEYISNDMSWDMVEKVVDYIYAGNDYTDGQPIPSIINYGTPVNKSANVYKLTNLILKTSNEESAEYNGMSTYYKNVMSAIDNGVYTYEGKEYSDWNNSKVPLFDIRCTADKNYVSNFAYMMQGDVDDMIFSIGSPEAFLDEIADNGSASARDVAEDGGASYTSSEAVKYLLNGGGNVAAAYDSSKRTGKRAVSDDDIIRVLEIQPCKDFLYEFDKYNVTSKNTVVSNIKALGSALGISGYSGLTNSSSYTNFINNGKKRIEFTCVTPQEFNGHNEDLVAYYDIIIVGTNKGQLTTDSSGNTIWNDKSLDGYVYLAYGDLVKGQDFLLGLLPRDFSTISSSQISNMNGYSFETKSSSSLKTTKDWDDRKYIYSMYNKNIWTPFVRANLDWSKYYVFNTAYIYKSYSNRDAFFNEEHGNTRLVGNDLTEKKLKELIEYLAVSRPVVLANNLYNCPSNGNKAAYPTSNMYEFAANAVTYDHVIKYGNIGSDLKSIIHSNDLKIEKCEMTYQKAGIDIIAPQIAYESNGLLKESCIVEGVEQFFYNLKFNAKAGKKYYVKAIIDKDTDGRFDSVPTIDDYNEVYYARKLVATGDVVELDLSIKLAEGYNGMFAWKILVEELDDHEVAVDAVSKQGYTVVTGDEKRVKALQIAPSNPTLDMEKHMIYFKNSSGWSNVYAYCYNSAGAVGPAWPGTKLSKTTTSSDNEYQFYCPVDSAATKIIFHNNNGTQTASFNYVEDGYYNASKYVKKIFSFQSLMDEAESAINYDIDIDIITADEFEAKFEGSSNKYTKGSSYGTSRDYLTSNGYNMIIFGFKDSWGGEDICNDYGAMDCIVDYIENGNSVLMSHDVLTFYNNANYGLCTNSGRNLVTRTGRSGSLILSLRLRSLIGMDVYNVSTIIDNSAATMEANNVPKKSDGTYIKEIQGYTNWHIYRYNEKYTYSSSRSSAIKTLSPWKGAESYMPGLENGGYSATYDSVTGATDTMVTTQVDEVNRGQVSMYPFKTTSENGTLTISKTHPQYYRLNLEDDDLVVWYTIGQSSQKYWQYYRDSGKDVANNYYIYSKGNITYSGAGHSTMNVESELKLFVNTVIRAAMAGNFTPKITVVNGSATKDEDTFVVFPNALDDIVQVDFIAFDEDLATREVVKDSYSTEAEIKEHIGRFTGGKVYYLTPEGDKKLLVQYSRTDPNNYLLNGETTSIVIKNPFEGLTGTALNNAYNAADSKTKNMYDCYMEYTSAGSVDLVIEVQDHAGATGRSVVEIVEHALFDLD